MIFFQRYGPPPSYPHLKIPGLNAPIPLGASFGYHPGGWGKPPVDEVSFLTLISSSCFLLFSTYVGFFISVISVLTSSLLPVCEYSLDVLCMEMYLAFSNKNSPIMRYFHIWVILIVIKISVVFLVFISEAVKVGCSKMLAASKLKSNQIFASNLNYWLVRCESGLPLDYRILWLL